MAKEDEILSKYSGKSKKPAQWDLMMGDEEEEKDENVNINENVNEDNNSSGVVSKYMQRSGQSQPKTSSDLVGIYFDPKVKAALAELQQRFGRGFKSEFVTEAVVNHIKKQVPKTFEEYELHTLEKGSS